MPVKTGIVCNSEAKRNLEKWIRSVISHLPSLSPSHILRWKERPSLSQWKRYQVSQSGFNNRNRIGRVSMSRTQCFSSLINENDANIFISPPFCQKIPPKNEGKGCKIVPLPPPFP